MWILVQAHSGPGLWEMFLQSGPFAKFILGVLVFMSLGSWAIMARKTLQIRRAEQENDVFLSAFRHSKRFSEVNRAAEDLTTSPLVGMFQAGYLEIDTQIKAAAGEDSKGDGYRLSSLPALERTLSRAAHVEVRRLGHGFGFLATTAAVSPFIGLLGTVWGIMVAFQSIGATGSTSLVAVAPGIAEALINTAAGLAAAIPALIGYNYFSNRLRQVRAQTDDFHLEFVNLAERNFS